MSVLRDLVKENNPFGRLTVVARVGSDRRGRAAWLCQCACGNQVTVIGKNLINGNTKSCGCYSRERSAETHFVGLTDRQFGRLKVIEQGGWHTYASGSNREAKWRCRCACGKEVTVRGADLTSRHTTSCGCRRSEDHNQFLLPLGARVSNLKSHARERSIYCELADGTVDALTVAQPCHYCGEVKGAQNGIDRMNSALGYQYGNVVSCCIRCNTRKGTKSYIAYLLELKAEGNLTAAERLRWLYENSIKEA
jgi:hypothetical protein